MDEFGEFPNDFQDTSSRSTNKVVLGCLIAAGVVVLLFVCCAFAGWTPFVRFGIGTDVNDFIDSVKASDLEPEPRDALAKRLRHVRDAIADDRFDMTLFDWLDHDTAIRNLIDDRRIPPDELVDLDVAITTLEGFIEPE